MEYVEEGWIKNQNTCKILLCFCRVVIYHLFSSPVSYKTTENGHGVGQMENKTSALFLLKLVWRTWPCSVATVWLPNTCSLRWTLSRIVSLPKDWTVEYSRMHCPTQQGVEPHMSISFSLACQSYYTILFLVMMNKGMETKGRLVLSAHDLAEHWNENFFPLEMSRVVALGFTEWKTQSYHHMKLNSRNNPRTSWKEHIPVSTLASSVQILAKTSEPQKLWGNK